MIEFKFEITLSVSDYYVDGDDTSDAFEECSDDTREAMDNAKEWIKSIVPAATFEAVEFKDISFCEFDSGNATHAAAYFDVTICGDAAPIAAIEAAIHNDLIGDAE